MKAFGLVILVLCVQAFPLEQCATYTESLDRRELVNIRTQKSLHREQRREEITESSSPRFFVEHEPIGRDRLVKICGPTMESVNRELKVRNVLRPAPQKWTAEKDEVFTLVENGPAKNRISLVFLGDGYQMSERGKFLDDMKRLNRNIFEDKTFRSYLPIFNVYAVFRPSTDSGIGKGTPKNTAYGLYREGNTLRAIFLDKPSAAHSACAQAPGCDYPIVIGNDPYYGGLGGEFSISTSSVTSGHVVLRHELGHSVGEIGEEYDGGGYFGANHSSSLSNLKWSHWLTDKLAAEPVTARKIDWPWVNLSQGLFRTDLASDGQWSSLELNFSVSGAQTDSDILISLDGNRLPFHSPGHSDRDFHSITISPGLANGKHVLQFEEGVEDGDNWLSSLTVHEFGSQYHFDKAFIGAFPVFTKLDAVDGYRPTHGTCLMREMKSDTFCPVCQENNWLKFFEKLDLIDSVEVAKEGDNFKVTVFTQPLGQFDERSNSGDTTIEINWLKNKKVMSEFSGKTSIVVSKSQLSDTWEVEAQFKTPEVRKDTQGLLNSKKVVTFPTL